MNHIQKTSFIYRLLFQVLIVCVPIFDFLYWALFNLLPEGFTISLPIMLTQKLSALSLSLAFLVSLLPVSVVVYGLVNLKEASHSGTIWALRYISLDYWVHRFANFMGMDEGRKLEDEQAYTV